MANPVLSNQNLNSQTDAFAPAQETIKQNNIKVNTKFANDGNLVTKDAGEGLADGTGDTIKIDLDGTETTVRIKCGRVRDLPR